MSVSVSPAAVSTIYLSVDLTGVDECGVLVELLPGPEPLLAGQGAGKGYAVRAARGDVQGGEVRVVARHGDGPALGVHLFIDRYFCHHYLDIFVPILTVCEESQARQSRIMLWTPLLTGVRVMSWSRNCPYCRVMVSSYQLSCVHNRDSNEG